MLTIKDISRSAHTVRWHIVLTNRKQTLAEHLYLTTMYTSAICDIVGIAANKRMVAVDWASVHDLPELMTGDIPTPMKRKIDKMAPGVIKAIEDSVDDGISRVRDAIEGTELEVVVKIADLFDSIKFLSVEGIGEHAATVCNEMQERLYTILRKAADDYPTLEWQNVRELYEELMYGMDNQIGFEKIC